MSKWIQHVKAYAAEHNISYKDAMSKAKDSFTKSSAAKEPAAPPSPTPPPPLSSSPSKTWIQHVKQYAAKHGVSYKDALSKAKDSYSKKAGAIKVYDKANDEKKVSVKATTSKLLKLTLSRKQGRALILKLLPEKVLATKAAVQLLRKFDNDASFRSDLLRLNSNNFKETVIAEVYKNLSVTIDGLDEKQNTHEMTLRRLLKKQSKGFFTKMDKTHIDDIKERLDDIKNEKDKISMATAALTAADSNIGADYLTQKIQRPRHKITSYSVMKDDEEIKNLHYYYQRLPSYYLRARNIKKQPSSVIDVANSVLLLQKKFPDKFPVRNVDDDPFIEYLSRFITSMRAYLNHTSEDVIKKNLPMINNKYKKNMEALINYKDSVANTGKHSYTPLKTLLQTLNENTLAYSGINNTEIKRLVDVTTKDKQERKNHDKMYQKLISYVSDRDNIDERVKKFYDLAEQDDDEIETWNKFKFNSNSDDSDSDDSDSDDSDSDDTDDEEEASTPPTSPPRSLPALPKPPLPSTPPPKLSYSLKPAPPSTPPPKLPTPPLPIRIRKPAMPRNSTPVSSTSASALASASLPSSSLSPSSPNVYSTPMRRKEPEVPTSTIKQFLGDDNDEVADGVWRSRRPTFKFLKNKKPKDVGGAKKVKMTIFTK